MEVIGQGGNMMKLLMVIFTAKPCVSITLVSHQYRNIIMVKF